MKKVFANVGIQPGPPNFLTPGRDGILVPGIISNNIRWNPSDTCFFDYIYENKSVNTGSVIEHVGINIYFRDFHLFIERVLKREVKPTDLVRIIFG